MNPALILIPVIASGGFLVNKGCGQYPTPDFRVGYCIRKTKLLNKDPRLGYYLKIVDTIGDDWVVCQGRDGSGPIDKKFYGCQDDDLNGYIGTLYSIVDCPDWPIDDEVYGVK